MTIVAWKEMLALTDRVAPELFEANDPIVGSPYADEIRKAIDSLSISAVFCNHGVPQIFILEQDEYDPDHVIRVHAALWNQGLASILVVISSDTVRVFSLAKAPGAGDHRQFEDHCLMEAVKAGTDALTLRDYVYGAESGRLWIEKAEYFDPKERIDHVLLNNLKVAHDLLLEANLLPDEAQAILIQTMFIAYLEDRGITNPDYFESATKGAYRNIVGLLSSGDVGILDALFAHLQRDFNGDLFVAPCSFDDKTHPHRLSAKAMDVLRRFRDGREEMFGAVGQLRFWGYDFNFIPVELISAVYDRFLGHDPNARREVGAYYTPMFLVDTVVSSVWDTLRKDVKDKGVFLDPACGSGIFLVRSFQRLCEQWRERTNSQTIRWPSLIKLLDRVHGRDLNGSAVRVAVFSLYIALLEEVTPPDIQVLAKRGRLLPPLWNRTLIKQDFFESEPQGLQVDVVLGNPPWTSRRSVASSGIAWCRKRGYPTPSGEEAWAFVWKAKEHLSEDGLAAFLLPSMGFLHNHAANSVAARERLFEKSFVHRVINFSDLRMQLFDSAIHPAAMLVFSKSQGETCDYEFEYWAPKADLNLAIKRFVTLSSIDKSMLSISDVKNNPLVFKQRLWMQAPEAKLYRYLDALPKMSEFVAQYGHLRRRKEDSSLGWVVGQGFKQLNAGSQSSSSGEAYQSEIVSIEKFLPIQAIRPLAVSTNILEPWHTSTVHRKGFERAFGGPRVLIPRGVATGAMRLRATYIDEPLTFLSIMQAIVAPYGEAERAKFITAVLNSRLAVWFAFHGTASFGSSRPEVQQSELLKIPMPEPNQLGDPAKARLVRKQLVEIVDREQRLVEELMCPANDLELALQEIDVLTYKYFDLSSDEVALIEDAVEQVIPAAQPSAGSFPSLWKRSVREERAVYAKQLAVSLSDWFGKDMGISLELAGNNKDFGVLKLSLCSRDVVADYFERKKQTFTGVLTNLSRTLDRPIARNFQTVPDMRIFAGQSLFLIKPMQRRFWLRSAALSDADNIAVDLQTLAEAVSQQGIAS